MSLIEIAEIDWFIALPVDLKINKQELKTNLITFHDWL
jgi:hypothetical protein